MLKTRILAILILIIGGTLGYFVAASEQPGNRFNFKLGLDLAGGTQLVYRADVSRVESGEVGDAMDALRDVIERRINLFGVAEPVIQVERAGLSGSTEERLIVELPGVTDVDEAVRRIGETPLLEFKLARQAPSNDSDAMSTTTPAESPILFEDTGLTGALLKRAELQFNQGTQGGGLVNEPIVLLTFNDEGAKLFEQITTDNIGQPLAIFLDGEILSMPFIQEPISGGTAVVSGSFTPTEGRNLVKNLNFGALPLAIELVSTQTIGATLGTRAIDAGLFAGIIGLLSVAVFLLIWYRVPGLIAIVALALYVVLNLVIIKLVPVTLTAAGIAGIVLSVGMAVDANILVFERIKEELRKGKHLREALSEGFNRAWLSIRDANVSSLITAGILFWFGTSLIKGFALTMGIGVLVSMFTALTVTRILLRAISVERTTGTVRFLFGSGIK